MNCFWNDNSNFLEGLCSNIKTHYCWGHQPYFCGGHQPSITMMLTQLCSNYKLVSLACSHLILLLNIESQSNFYCLQNLYSLGRNTLDYGIMFRNIKDYTRL